jgi:hypothetical protein
MIAAMFATPANRPCLKNHFVLTKVSALTPYGLRLTYADGEVLTVNLQPWIASTKALHPLKNADLFVKAKRSLGGRSVDWADGANVELDLGADNLRNLAIEQAGGIGHERIWNWLHETGLTLEQAAQALGISRRMLIYYRDGEKPIPRSVWLACLGWEAVRPVGQSLPQHIPTVREYAALHG